MRPLAIAAALLAMAACGARPTEPTPVRPADEPTAVVVPAISGAPWTASLGANGGVRLRYRGTDLLRMEYPFHGPDWSWANPTVSEGEAGGGRARFAIDVPGFHTRIDAVAEPAEPGVLAVRFTMHVERDLAGVIGGGPELDLVPDARSFRRTIAYELVVKGDVRAWDGAALENPTELRFVVGAKGKMLHRASSAGQRAIARMGNTHGDRNLVDVGKLNNRKIAAVIHAQEGVQASRNPVHVKKCNQRTAHHLGEEGDMLLYVCCHDRDVVDSARLLLRRRHRSVPYLTLVID